MKIEKETVLALVLWLGFGLALFTNNIGNMVVFGNLLVVSNITSSGVYHKVDHFVGFVILGMGTFWAFSLLATAPAVYLGWLSVILTLGVMQAMKLGL